MEYIKMRKSIRPFHLKRSKKCHNPFSPVNYEKTGEPAKHDGKINHFKF